MTEDRTEIAPWESVAVILTTAGIFLAGVACVFYSVAYLLQAMHH